MYNRLAVVQPAQTAKLYQQLKSQVNRKKTRKRILRFSLVGANALLIVAVVTFILGAPHSGSASPAILSSNDQTAVANPLDQLSSADIAVTVSQLTNVPETPAIMNQAQTEHAQLAMSSATESVASKPQVVATGQKSRSDIQQYTTVAGDTVASIAARFSVSSDSIRWSNGLAGNTVNVGVKLSLPPAGMSGVVYTVKAGDTVDSLAAKYKADKQKILQFNDAELSGLVPGQQVFIPDGSQAVTAQRTTSSGGYASGFLPQYGGNGYDYGYCTWYVASRIAVPNNWGNANSWAYYAASSGWTVSSTPIVGAIAQTPSGYAGHVAIVEAVSPDGTQIKYSDMNGIAGWGRVGYSDWVSASYFPHYIYH